MARAWPSQHPSAVIDSGRTVKAIAPFATGGSHDRSASARPVLRDRGPHGGDRSLMSGHGAPGAPRPAAALAGLPATEAERRISGRAARKRVKRGTLGHGAEGERGHDALETILAQNQL